MNLERFIREAAATVGFGAGERRFARDLARSLGFRVAEPENTTRGKRVTGPGAAPTPAPTPAQAEPISAGFAAGQEHGQSWGFSRAYRSDLQRLIEWVDTVRGEFTVSDVVAVVFPKPAGEWAKHDAERLAQSNLDYARGFVVGGMLVWAHQLAAQQSKE
jgi:hypothetical protein